VFFPQLSNFLASATLQLPKGAAVPLVALGNDCLLCGAGCHAPLICAACEGALPRLGAACDRCAVPLPQAGTCGECLRHRPAFDEVVATFEYRFPVDRLVQRFKFSADLAAGHWLAMQLLARVGDQARPDWIVAPPLAAQRLRRRGFNQALEIAKTMGRRLGVPVALRGLRKLRDTDPQPGLSRRERRANLRGAFGCDLALSDAHVALVDDVVTTGATADAVARALKAAGAARVSVWAVARTPDPAR
jgi:ComF family protein